MRFDRNKLEIERLSIKGELNLLNTAKTNKLKEHHKNGYYFTDIEGGKI